MKNICYHFNHYEWMRVNVCILYSHFCILEPVFKMWSVMHIVHIQNIFSNVSLLQNFLVPLKYFQKSERKSTAYCEVCLVSSLFFLQCQSLVAITFIYIDINKNTLYTWISTNTSAFFSFFLSLYISFLQASDLIYFLTWLILKSTQK